ncbi:hypothetical protein BRD00_13365 [Halobacteriales archaeon QS_8_69_26]|nr:MAG: hypothetical protein BRD00_13365 [Halobacteriales archaeon QS_8_69_26]
MADHPRDGPVDDAGGSRRLDVLTKRTGVLRRLREGPAYKRDLVGELDQSRSTINRAVNDLEAVGFVERSDAGFVATVAGRLALERLETFRTELDELAAADAVLDPLPVDAPLDVAAVAGGEVLLASEPVPHRPLERFHDALAAAERYRAVLPVLDDPRHVRLLYEHVVTGGRPAELVVSPELFRALRTEFPRRMAAMAESDGFDLLVGDVPPFALVLLDGDDADPTVHVVAFADSGGVHGVLANDAASAVRWAEGRYDDWRAAAEERTESLVPDPDGGTRVADPDGGLARAAVGRSVSVALEREGFVRLGTDYFREEPVADPTTAWRAGLSIPEVHTGYAVERTLDAGSESGDAGGSDGDADEAHGDAEEADAGEEDDPDGARTDVADPDRSRTMAAALATNLAAGTDCVVVGPPGSGKSTVCKRVACEWYDADRGIVLYREGDRGRPFRSVEDLVVTVDTADGHVLVVVEDAVRPDADAVFEAIDRLGDREDVSFLLDAREGEWWNPPGDPGDPSDPAVVHVPSLAEGDAERLVEHFERTVDETVGVPVERLREEVRAETAGDATVPDEVLLLLHRLAIYADPLAEERTSLEDAVAAVHEDLADDDLALDACVLANAVNAAGIEVDPGLLYAVADPGEFDAVDAAVERLEGRVLFPREDGSYRTVHEAWSVAFLDHLLDAEGEAAGPRRFGDCVTALLALADDPDRRERIRDHGGSGRTLAAVADDPGRWADGTVEAVYALGRERPKLAPLFGDGGRDSVGLPDACSTGVANERTVWHARMLLGAGRYDDVREAVERGLESAPAESRTACRLLGLRATVHKKTGDTDAARKAARRQRDLAASLGARDLEAEAIGRLGTLARDGGDLDRARELLEEALGIAQELGDRSAIASHRNSLGRLAWNEGDYERAREHHEAAVATARERSDRASESNYLVNLGVAAQRQGEYEEADEHFRAALEVMRATGDRRGEAVCLGNLSMVAQERGDHERALEYDERALEISREIGDRDGVGRTLNNMGMSYEKLGNYERAREYYERAREVFRELDDPWKESFCAGNLAKIARRCGEYDRAREHHEAVLEIARDLGNAEGEGRSLNHLGRVDRRQGADDRARERHETALEIARENDEAGVEAAALVALGTLARRRGDPDRAREHYEEGLEIARGLGDGGTVADALRGLAAVARRTGATDRAREYLDDAPGADDGSVDEMGAATVRLERARVALAAGDVEAARETTDRAEAAFETRGADHWLGRTRTVRGRIAAATAAPVAAREHWRDAIETFEAVGAPGDALATLRHLVETCREGGDDGAVGEWLRRAEEVFDDAPDPVADRHREWIDRNREAIDDD